MDISVIIPVYNAASSISKCVDSVVGQTGFSSNRFEIILIDDGSTDDSGSICDKLCKKYSNNNLRVIHQENQGVSAARNIGIREATGQYITFIDSDDTIASDAFHYMYSAIGNSDIKIVSMLGNLADLKSCNSKDTVVNGFEYIEKYLLHGDTHVWGKLFKRDFVVDIVFEAGLTIGEDMLFLLNVAEKIGAIEEILCLHKQKYNYFDNANGAMKKDFKMSYLDQIKCWNLAEKKMLGIRQKTGFLSDDKVFQRLAVIQTYAAILVAGKLARLDYSSFSEEDKENFDKAVSLCKESVEKSLSIRGIFYKLDMGYKIKVVLFKINPFIFFRLYGSWKNGR